LSSHHATEDAEQMIDANGGSVKLTDAETSIDNFLGGLCGSNRANEFGRYMLISSKIACTN
jgi:hypothetical protein